MLEQQLALHNPEGLYGLMEQAGAALDAHLQRDWPHAQRLWIFCGQGNNGGDGYVLARLARQRGLIVEVYALGAPKPDSEAARAYQLWLADGGQVQTSLPMDPDATHRPDLLVDALLGIGPQVPLQGRVLEWIDYINRQSVPVLAVDLPSGLHGATGCSLGSVVRATHTVTFIGLKPGLFTGQGPEVSGIVSLCPLAEQSRMATWIGCDDLTVSRFGILLKVDYEAARRELPPRSRVAHKGRCGRVLVVGGGLGMPGAIRLAAEAALRTGAGLVKVASRIEHQSVILSGRPELMWSACGTCNTDYAASAVWASVRVLGPGLGLDEWARSLWEAQVLRPGPLVLDADALNLLAEAPVYREDWILTPHPGEAARLLACTVAEVEQDRLLAVRRLQQRYGGVVLLKGAGTLVCDEKNIWLCQEGNPGMASGGMGDLLSGIIAALWGQGLSPAVAAWVGVCVHGEAADIAARDGERGMLASDLLPFIRRLVNSVESLDEH